MTKRPQGISAQFKKLDAKGNAHDCDAHNKPHHIVDEGNDYSAKKQPEDISKEFHITYSLNPYKL